MEDYLIEKDIPVFCVKAKSFPSGVKEAHEKLHRLLPPDDGRRYFGISYPDHDTNILYLAAVAVKNTEDVRGLILDTFVIKKGRYTCEVIHDFMKDIPGIGRLFDKLLTHAQLDPKGYCVEEYFNDSDVRCLVKLKDN